MTDAETINIPLLSLEEAISSSREAIPTKPGVYLLLKEGIVAYVGRSKSCGARIGQHSSLGLIEFDRWVVIPCEEACQSFMEARYIKKFDPPYNLARPSGQDMEVPRGIEPNFDGEVVRALILTKREMKRRRNEAITRRLLASMRAPIANGEQ